MPAQPFPSDQELVRIAGTATFKRAQGYVNSGAVDITQDFLIASTKVRISAGARFLFVAAQDIFYSDNADPDGNYAVRITVL